MPFALRAMAEPVAATPKWVLLGTDLGKGIYRARWDAVSGELGPVELAIATDRPDFFAMHPKLPVLYSVNSVGDGKGGVSSFRVDAATGGLTLLNRVSSHGDGPCAVSVSLPWTFVANYTGGSFAAYGVAEDGALVDDRGGFDCRRSAACGVVGPVKDRQDAAHLHCVTVAPNGDAVVCDLGDDALLVFAGPKEQTQPPLRYAARRGSGPRHVAFHPNKRWMYCIHELDCTIDLYDWSVHGWKAVLKLREESVISTLPKGASLKGNTACEIAVSDDGRFVYSCTRGVDEITVYRVDATTGLLTEQQRLSCGGNTPRYFAFDPSRRWLVCTNQGTGTAESGSVTVFAHDAATGRLSETPKTFAAESPMFVLWV
jgi:6-phosphogluconolactonase (cycloisomerase 2 family)